MCFENKVTLVTGASRGIGQAIALTLGQAGATVIGTATSEEGAQAISAYLAKAGIKGEGMQLDVTDTLNTDGVLKNIANKYGDIAILINNAGITRDNLLLRMKDEEWDEVVHTNLRAIFQLSKAVLRGMTKARWGRIINIASVVGATGNPGQTNYAATKAAIFGFTKSLAKEVGSRNITVNAVAPGFIDTDMTRDLPQEQREKLLQTIALGRLGEAQEIADSVAFLASDKATYITGNTLHVNGGMFMN
jgi:3-oxoacyl-[acyl-carrier protein] reductase